MTPSEEFCEAHFAENTSRMPNGQFVVSIPFALKGDNILGDSKEMAINRFHSLERRLLRNNLLKKQYGEFMQEYIDLGHMTKISEVNNEGLDYYIPHHPVIKPTSSTTKLRVVFDASAKTTNGKSLNDVQLVGPTIQRDIFAILLSFRKYAFAFTADITKMYRMVLVNSDHRAFQRIFWRSDPSLPLSCFELNTVTYGTASASFLAIRCLSELAQINKENYPLISDIIMNCFSVDDVLSGSDNFEELTYIQRELTRVLASGGFELRKWASNNKEFLNNICNGRNDDNNFVITSAEGFKALGLAWNQETDNLSFCVDLKVKGSQVTKRQVLSCIEQIFDPLGLITPITTSVKVILRRLWQLGLSWDEAIPLDLRTKWLSIKDGFNLLSEIRVPRHITCRNPVRSELHGFCDASEMAYGACIYIRSSDEFSNITVRLLASKGRVAPLKRLSIPRLELCGAVILSQLIVKVRESLNITFDARYCWSDSTVTLAWIKGCPSRWKTFVSNRVTEIQGNTNVSNWYHVSGIENPADLLSRGLEPGSLINDKLWWHGPSWLLSPTENWPLNSVNIPENSIPEQRSVALVSITEFKNDFFDKFSTFSKLRRVIAYCLRFIKNTTIPKENRIIGWLSTNEINASTLALVKLAQKESFSREIVILSLIKDRKLRGAKLIKAYICLFICFATRAIHLELVGDLTSDSFIAALRRFASRRGKPANIYSDNGTNFVGAEGELSELFAFIESNKSVIDKRANDEGIHWHFIPPRAPHFGGLWEAGVKSTKTHLKRVLMNSNVTYEEFNTILVQIEGCLNSRPLSPLS